MKRRSIKVIKSRLEDIEVGDVVNRSPDAELGWFTVAAISTLFNGNIQLADESEQLTVSGDHKDMVGLQLVEEVVLDERGIVAPPAPPAPIAIAAAPVGAAPVAAAPATAAAPITAAMTATPVPPVPAPPSATPPSEATIAQPAPDQPIAAPQPAAEQGPIDPVAEAAAAAEVAVAIDLLPAVKNTAPVDLELVLNLLEQLDVGDPLEDDEAHFPPLPANAVALDGGAPPARPSYREPVVIAASGMLPRRDHGT